MGRNKITLSPMLSIGHSEEAGLCVARFRELGLTAYGKTDRDARTELYDLLSAFLRHAIKYGTLEAQLNHSKVDWSIERADSKEPTGFTILREPTIEDEERERPESDWRNLMREIVSSQLVTVE